MSFLVLTPLVSAASRSSVGKQAISSEVKITKKVKSSQEEQKKKKQNDKWVIEKKIAELQTKLKTLNIEIESLQIKASVARMTSISNPENYKMYIKKMTIARQSKKKIEEELASNNKILTSLNLWLKRNP